MSGGTFEYKQYGLAEEIFGYRMNLDYGEEGFKQSKMAARKDPLHDVELSEMLWDMLCIVHSFDYWDSGDTGEERYRTDVKHFKEKWLGKTPEQRTKKMISDALERAKEDAEIAFGERSEE